MKCPNDNTELEQMLFHQVEVDYCPKCLGMWFDKDELEYAKDDKDQKLNWLDIDLWRDKAKFHLVKSGRYCPYCSAGLMQVGYDSSSSNDQPHVKMDFCKNCQGVWLDRGEFKQLMIYLKKKSDYEILHHYTKNLITELWEVFSGPKDFREELADFLILSKLLKYKFVTQHPFLEKWIESLPK
ncbi:MAG: hypothetical protein A3D35_00190 [Candidatus Staskawiczbacteria bacterium RIFCSPHIGHO2_02_FULL_34_9]|uniref:Transcription factor zinc-finger domain-containing protein n=1 Tax=Candidatus Staskawiczbacteria bacterium RIFCSPHIGHO2_02_FULL_34_9 TaxID=1802206 RepID=A0A1G2HZA0_9BACT|nr:MAG: hypothetical protein A3D35_00190 [Candidatus Staskawiczbacteria bacterium RIFCSPHIGHO2_02_FULL_34_9]